jgi:anaerobic selenocysteine-containing dehydrogenase
MAIKRAKARGARVLVIDPFRTPAAEIADLWLRPRPGTDGAIALAMIKIFIDEGLSATAMTLRAGAMVSTRWRRAFRPARRNGPRRRPA